MSRSTILDQIRIASPCEADWNGMLGDDRTRFCSLCSKNVHNIAAMTAEEATALILEAEGKLCVQIYRRADGTVLTADCPVGLGRISAGRRLRRVVAMGLVLPALVVAGVTAKGIGKKRIEPFPSGPGVTWDDRVDWALVTLGIRQRRQLFPYMGMFMLSKKSNVSSSEKDTTLVCPPGKVEVGEPIPLPPEGKSPFELDEPSERTPSNPVVNQ
jgi:hypothetical protein